MTAKSQQKRIDLVTRPVGTVVEQPGLDGPGSLEPVAAAEPALAVEP